MPNIKHKVENIFENSSICIVLLVLKVNYFRLNTSKDLDFLRSSDSYLGLGIVDERERKRALKKAFRVNMKDPQFIQIMN